MKAVVSALALSLAVASLGSQASAAVAYSNFGEGGDYNTMSGSTILGSSNPVGYYKAACSFVSLVSGTVDSYEIPGFYDIPSFNIFPDHSVTLNLLDGAPWSSSNTLDSVSLTFALYPSAVIAKPSASHPQLVAGQTYWLEMLPSEASTVSTWCFNSIGSTGYYINYAGGGGNWVATDAVTPAFSVQASVPEPTCLSLIGVTAALVLSRRRAV